MKLFDVVDCVKPGVTLCSDGEIPCVVAAAPGLRHTLPLAPAFAEAFARLGATPARITLASLIEGDDGALALGPPEAVDRLALLHVVWPEGTDGSKVVGPAHHGPQGKPGATPELLGGDPSNGASLWLLEPGATLHLGRRGKEIPSGQEQVLLHWDGFRIWESRI